MNIINVKVSFEKGTLTTKGIAVITGDYNSTELDFTFDKEGGTKIFEMKSPSDELVMASEIVNNKIVLVGYVDVTTEHNSKTYTKYIKDNEIYWYQPTDEKLYDDEWAEVITFDLEEYTKVQEEASLFNEAGNYIFEISLYESGSKLTSVYGKIPVKQEQVVIDGEIVTPYLPIFDELLTDVNEALTETNNLNISASKTDHTTTITITKKDGTTQETQVLDGEDGTSLEDIEIDNNDLKVTYGGSTENLGQVCPVIQIGTTTTGQPNTQASVTNTGTALNPIFNFTIPKGEAGAIKFLIVNELPATGADDTIYLVPITPDVSGNNYAEYVYINGAWELLGKIGVQVDLTDYVKNTDYAAQGKPGVVQPSAYYGTQVVGNGVITGYPHTYQQYLNSVDSRCVIDKTTLENVITGKGLVSNTNYATASTGGVVMVNSYYGAELYNGILLGSTKNYATYVNQPNSTIISKGTLDNVLNARIGDIASVIDAINGESI